MSPFNSPPRAQDHQPKLKPSPKLLPALDPGCRSDVLHPSAIPSGADFRAFYLEKLRSGESASVKLTAFVPPPLISASPFVPRKLIELLMRGKKDSAIGVKHVAGDMITDMEGALHTFVTPVISRCEIVGDYKYEYGHGIVRFGSVDNQHGEGKVRLMRSVALSAAIQPDFENSRVMLRVCKLDATEVIGKDVADANTYWEPDDVQAKKDPQRRAAYESKLRAHMVFHLVSTHRLPARAEIQTPLSTNEAIHLLEAIITSSAAIEDQLVNEFIQNRNYQVVSLELLYNSAIQQVINEFSALESLFEQGYIYTYDPPSIFAREIGSEILNRLFLAAVKAVSSHNTFKNLKVFAINDYADKRLVSLAISALAAQHNVRCVPKSEIYDGLGGSYGGSGGAAMLVIHNNSDGFGQNIETEGMGGSMDGAIGASSSAAASLEREREDLLAFVF